MTRIGASVAVVGCLLSAGVLTGCGSSHNESNATVCSKLRTDGQALSSSASSNNPKVLAATFKTAASKFKADVAKAKSADLRNNVNKVADSLDQIASQLAAGKTPDIQHFESQIASAQQQVQGQCPNLGTSSSSPSP